MANKYSLVSGASIGLPIELPASWENISNLSAMMDDELRALGWYPVVENVPSYDANLEKLGTPTLTMVGNQVQADYPKVPLTAEERSARRAERYAAEADPYLPEAEVELRQGRPEKYFAYMAARFKIRRETEPEATRLPLVVEDQLTYWKTYCDLLINAKYPATNRDAYKQLMDDALAAGLTNRAAYLRALNDWSLELFNLFYGVAGQIMAATNWEDAAAAAIGETDVQAWEADDPHVSFAGALAIPD